MGNANRLFILLSFFFSTPILLSAQPPQEAIEYMVNQVNELRAKGCKCGSKRMKPAQPIRWNSTLYKTARSHALEMRKYNYFGHISRNGKDVGERFDDFGYDWQYAGENLGEGQEYFYEVFQDWIESPSHCRMLMHPGMTQMGISKQGKYWVQHFGKPMPKNYYKKGRVYTEN